ncbi:MAG: gamma-glutamylcyclotransferase [Epsilonproteobacteria bacterium]|nr:gamma-glutamylcyclotransferase [Campylobacterota bacterium]
MEYIFVYGTLRSCFDNFYRKKLLRYATFIGEGEVDGRLYKVSWYPALIEEEGRVKGEVYKIKSASLLKFLDYYEGFKKSNPKASLYIRKLKDVYMNGETIKAWVYVYNKKVSSKDLIKSGDFCKGN